MPYFGRYISGRAAEKLLEYKYKGQDDSLFYYYVGNPTYTKIVEHLPTWLAPNTITVCGLLLTLIEHLLFVHYCPDLQGAAPTWLYLYGGLAIIGYQTLDAVDGKQARKTGSGSPLGLLMDHGCDAVNTTVLALSLASVLQLGPTWRSALLWASAGAGFFFATLEEYYTGELHLPIINGPNEGLLIISLIHFITAAVGPQLWLQQSGLAGLSYGEIVLYFSAISAVLTMITNLVNILGAVKERQGPAGESMSVAEKDSNSVRVAATRFLPLGTILIGMMVWVLYSPSDIMGRYPRLVLWTQGLAISKLVTGIMVAHLSDQEYHPFSRTTAALLVLLFHSFVGVIWYPALMQPWHEDLLLWEMAAILAVSYSHMVLSLAQEVSTALGVYIFTITSKRPKLNQKME